MKNLKFKLVACLTILLLVGVPFAFSSDGSDSSTGSTIINWITAIGIPGILAFAFSLWKKGPKIISRVVTFIISIIDSLGNLLVQVTEAQAALKNDLQKLKEYVADGDLTQSEIQSLITAIEQSYKEFEDVPKAITQLKTDFTNAVKEFKASKE